VKESKGFCDIDPVSPGINGGVPTIQLGDTVTVSETNGAALLSAEF
jgi:hypothetical protein